MTDKVRDILLDMLATLAAPEPELITEENLKYSISPEFTKLQGERIIKILEFHQQLVDFAFARGHDEGYHDGYFEGYAEGYAEALGLEWQEIETNLKGEGQNG